MTRVDLGRTYIMDTTSDPRRGIEFLERAERLEPLDPWIHLRLATLRVRTGDYEAARKHLEVVEWAGDARTRARGRALEEKIARR